MREHSDPHREARDSLVTVGKSDERAESPTSLFVFEVEGQHVGNSLSVRGVAASSEAGDPPHSIRAAKQSSFQASVVNLANTIVGSSVLAFPFAFASCGFALGVALLLLFASAAMFGLHLLSACALKVGLPATFRSVTAAALPGGKWPLLVDGVVAFKCFGVATSYLVVMGDTIPLVTGNPLHGRNPPLNPRQFWMLVGLCVATPLCFSASLDKLKFTSALSLVFVGFLTAVVAVGYLLPGLLVSSDDDDHNDRDAGSGGGGSSIEAAKFDITTVSQLTVFIFGFTCHQNVFPITNELGGSVREAGGETQTPREHMHPSSSRRRHQQEVDAVIVSAVSVALVVYLVVASTGYATFGAGVESDILSSYGPSLAGEKGMAVGVVLVAAARLMVACLMCFSYPLQCHPCRACLFTLAASAWPHHLETPRQRYCFHVLSTSLIVGMSFAVALAVRDLSDVLSVVGATGSTTVSYILPGIAYFRLFPHPHKMRSFAFALFLSGCVIMPLALAGVALREAAAH